MKISLGSYLALPDVDSFVPSTISDPNPNNGGTELLVKLREKESLHPNVRLLQSSAAGQLASNYTDITRTATPYFVFHLNSFRVSLGKPFGNRYRNQIFFLSKRLIENERNYTMATPELPEPMNSSPHHSKVKISTTLSDPTFVAGNFVSGKLDMECRADIGLGIGILMVELFAIQGSLKSPVCNTFKNEH